MFKRIRRVLVLAVFLFAGYKAYRVHQDVKQVMTYQPMVREILSEKDTPANEELVLAMIYTETKEKKAMLCSLVSLLVALPIPSMIMPLAFGKVFKL